VEHDAENKIKNEFPWEHLVTSLRTPHIHRQTHIESENNGVS
jgi:hypothetical protein